MSVPTAELTAPAAVAPTSPPLAAFSRRFSGGRLYLWLAGAALVIGALSLLVPSTPSYDPWAWLVWGREIVHFNLQTTGGPTWKPLPVVFTTLFAPFGKAAPDMWLVLARAGAVMAAAMVFKVAVRITRMLQRIRDDHAGQLGRYAIAPGLLAGAIAAVGLVFSGGFISDNALGYSEGLMTALVLIAVDRHLEGHRRQAFAISFAAALDRPEIWVVWGPYGLWLWWTDPGARRLVIGLFALIPVLWFLPEYWGSGHFFRGVNRAHHPRSNSPAFAKCPFCTELADHAWRTVLLRIKIAALLAVGIAAASVLWALRARGGWESIRARGGWRALLSRDGLGLQSTREHALVAVLTAGLLGLAWWLIIGVMTQVGFSGNDRYLVLGAALIDIAGGVGWGWAALELGGLLGRASKRAGPGGRRLQGAAAGWFALAVAVACFVLLPNFVANNLIDLQRTHRALVYQAHLREDAARVVSRLGASRILRCGTVMTEGFQVPMVAWTLGVHTARIEASPLSVAHPGVPPNVIFQTRAQRKSHLLPIVRGWKQVHYHLVARVRTFRIYSNCRDNLSL